MSLNLNLYGGTDQIKVSYAKFLMSREFIDLDAKSINGWLRVLNSKKKIKYYGINLNENELEVVKSYLKDIKVIENEYYNKDIK